MEIEGPMAMFTDPASNPAQRSYPIPTWSQTKGIFEAVCMVHSAFIDPVAVEMCKPLKYYEYKTNNRGPLRDKTSINNDTPYQRHISVLEDPCFRLYGVVKKLTDNLKMTTNPEHALQCIFNKNLKKQKCRYHPCLGLKEFHCTYFGPIREDTEIVHVQEYNKEIPTMLYSIFDENRNGEYSPQYIQNAMIIDGRFVYDK